MPRGFSAEATALQEDQNQPSTEQPDTWLTLLFITIDPKEKCFSNSGQLISVI